MGTVFESNRQNRIRYRPQRGDIVAIIYQGDQYLLPIKIKQGDTVISDEMVEKVRIGIGPFKDLYPDGGITYADGYWLFPLTETMTYDLLAGENKLQAQVNFPGNVVISSVVYEGEIGQSLLRGVWTQDDTE